MKKVLLTLVAFVFVGVSVSLAQSVTTTPDISKSNEATIEKVNDQSPASSHCASKSASKSCCASKAKASADAKACGSKTASNAKSCCASKAKADARPSDQSDAVKQDDK
ncbi:MAG TPA: hypothetical protein PKH65_05840 [Bacteroidia bacterium]|nr:hypothetical protein [Bacteroidia bacterium]HNT80185.1 hypothetical protein [Bacteroidia bacterium]